MTAWQTSRCSPTEGWEFAEAHPVEANLREERYRRLAPARNCSPATREDLTEGHSALPVDSPGQRKDNDRELGGNSVRDTGGRAADQPPNLNRGTHRVSENASEPYRPQGPKPAPGAAHKLEKKSVEQYNDYKTTLVIYQFQNVGSIKKRQDREWWERHLSKSYLSQVATRISKRPLL